MTSARQRLVVVQPLPGIGDMIWHLPHIRAFAAHAGGPVTLVAKPRSHADQIFAAEDTVADIIWMDRNPDGGRGRHDGPAGLWRLMHALRAGRFDSAVLLHHSLTLALVTLAAGVPVRQGYGIGAQRWFLSHGPYLSTQQWRRNRPLQRANLFLQAAGIPIDDPEPRLPVAPAARIAVQERLRHVAQPFAVLGIGSSEPTRQWGAARFADLARTLIDAGWPSLVLAGGPREEPLRHEIETRLGNDASRLVPALGWHLGETAALLAEARFYVGNDTGVMNMAAAVGTCAYALFGTTPALHHSAHIVPILSPPGGPTDGTARITVTEVLKVIARDRGSLAPESGSDTNAAARRANTRR
jgi:heptosyltransferase-2